MPVINFVNEKKQIEVPEGTNLRKAAMQAGVQLYPHVHQYLNCHGLAQCGSCRVLVTSGRTAARTRRKPPPWRRADRKQSDRTADRW